MSNTHRKTPSFQATASANAAPRVSSTPWFSHRSERVRFSCRMESQAEINKELAYDMKGYFLGPMPKDAFLQSFMPPGPKPADPSKTLLNAISTAGPHEKKMYKPLVALFASLSSTLTLVDTSSRADPICDMKPDCCAYKREAGNPNGYVPDGTDFSQTELIVELKKKLDPFCDKGSGADFPFEREGMGDDHRLARGQLAAYASAMFGMQHRTHLFMLTIHGSLARFLRWDTAGVIITEAFDYTKCNTLAEFVWRFDNMTAIERGVDPSLIHPRLSNAWVFQHVPLWIRNVLANQDSYVTADESGKLIPHPSLTRHSHYAIIRIPRRSDPTQESSFVISVPPKFCDQGCLGRCPRKFAGFDLDSQEIVLISEYWRTVGSEKEGDIYSKLKSRGVHQGLAPFGMGNDVRDIRTQSQDFQASPRTWGYMTEAMDCRRLYRLSLKVYAAPVTEFKELTQLLHVFADALTAHDDSFFDGKILHRDITPNSIMIDKHTGRGILTDWDVSLSVDANLVGPRSSQRGGTWQFASERITNDPTVEATLADDRESALYALIWVLVLYTFHNQVGKEDQLKLLRVFDTRKTGETKESPPSGDHRKSSLLSGAGGWKRFTFQHAQPIAKLVSRLARSFFARYDTDAASDEDEHVRSTFDLYISRISSQRYWLVDELKGVIPVIEKAGPTPGANRNSISTLVHEKARKAMDDTTSNRAHSLDILRAAPRKRLLPQGPSPPSSPTPERPTKRVMLTAALPYPSEGAVMKFSALQATLPGEPTGGDESDDEDYMSTLSVPSRQTSVATEDSDETRIGGLETVEELLEEDTQDEGSDAELAVKE